MIIHEISREEGRWFSTCIPIVEVIRDQQIGVLIASVVAIVHVACAAAIREEAKIEKIGSSGSSRGGR